MNYTKVSRAASLRSARIAADIQTLINNRSYYKFQYTPLTGPLPGLSFEQQTEDAINDIGNMSYGSYEIATQALTTANQAYNAAQSAIEIANHAETTAQNAQTTANNAATAAAGAQETADNAATAAAEAQTTADNAVIAAANAQETADNAQASANAAIATATTAQTTADNAQNDATSALNRLDSLTPVVEELRYYDNIDTAVDLNDKTEFARELLEASNNTNAPEIGSGWLDVDDDFNETYIRQKFMGKASGKTYVRFGTIVPDSDPVTVSEWSNWVEYTLKADLDNTTTDLTEKINTVATDLAGHEADYNNPHKVTAEQLGLTTVYQYKGSVATYADLPTTGQKVGDVWNVETADPDHGIKAGDNVAWDGTQWDKLGGDHDFSELNAEINARLPLAGGTMTGSILFEESKTAQGILNSDGNGFVVTGTPQNVPVIIDASKKPGQTVYLALQSPDGESFNTVRFSLNNDSFATITGVGVPTNPYDVANKMYVDNAIGAGGDEFLSLTGGTLTGPLLLPADTPTQDTQAVTKKYVDDSISGGGGDVTAAGNNIFTGPNTFNNTTTLKKSLIFTDDSVTHAISIPTSGTKFLNIDLAEETGLRIRENNVNIMTVGQKEALHDQCLRLNGNQLRLNDNGNYSNFSDNNSIFFGGNAVITYSYAFKNLNIRAMGDDNKLELGVAAGGWNIQLPNNNGDVRVANRLYVGGKNGAGAGVISADNAENCLYFMGTAENTYYATPNTGNTISYQASANCYLINCSINNPASLNMNFSGMNFKATVGSIPYMCKTLTFWIAVGATVPTVAWTFPNNSAVYYPKGVAPALTANANNIINVIAIVDDTDSFSIQVCDTVALPFSG